MHCFRRKLTVGAFPYNPLMEETGYLCFLLLSQMYQTRRMRGFVDFPGFESQMMHFRRLSLFVFVLGKALIVVRLPLDQR